MRTRSVARAVAAAAVAAAVLAVAGCGTADAPVAAGAPAAVGRAASSPTTTASAPAPVPVEAPVPATPAAAPEPAPAPAPEATTGAVEVHDTEASTVSLRGAGYDATLVPVDGVAAFSDVPAGSYALSRESRAASPDGDTAIGTAQVIQRIDVAAGTTLVVSCDETGCTAG